MDCSGRMVGKLPDYFMCRSIFVPLSTKLEAGSTLLYSGSILLHFGFVSLFRPFVSFLLFVLSR